MPECTVLSIRCIPSIIKMPESLAVGCTDAQRRSEKRGIRSLARKTWLTRRRILVHRSEKNNRILFRYWTNRQFRTPGVACTGRSGLDGRRADMGPEFHHPGHLVSACQAIRFVKPVRNFIRNSVGCPPLQAGQARAIIVNNRIRKNKCPAFDSGRAAGFGTDGETNGEQHG